ncbi:MAG TPA: hypothetical protein ENH62_07700 [Marinobacter sp.]|uniref:Uncharacterized protein n=1 Tax=marine sediment metagenome TaxID=412755 RepID=A0A0F9R0T2_9ZZZZ|nr:hypothetical protein [Marinobacter sp.]
MNTRTRLELGLCQEDNRLPDGTHEGCLTACVHAGRDSVCPYARDADVALDILMEPGEAAHAAFEAMDKPTCHGDPKARAWDVLQGYRAILTAIREGK